MLIDIHPHHHFINSSIVLLFSIFFIALSYNKKFRHSNFWKATVTPLASIIGSGFLVVTPLFALILGKYAIYATIAMVVLAYLMGYVMRFNIYKVEPQVANPKKTPSFIAVTEYISYAVLGFAFLISVPFYIKLLSLFLLRGFDSKSSIIANCIATLILGFIGIYGKIRGFKRLEFLEEYAVNFKLSIICAMIVGLIIYNAKLVYTHSYQIMVPTPQISIDTLRKFLGTIIIIQGFETSRFLSLFYNADMRVKTMRYAQIISGVIYVVFVGLALVVFNTINSINETSIIDVSDKVAVILPYVLIFAAVLSQFSAAIADTVGAGGLFSEATFGHLKHTDNYLLIAIGAIILTWLTNIFQIITLASRAFALYYAIQGVEAAVVSFREIHDFSSACRLILFTLISLTMFIVFVFGMPT